MDWDQIDWEALERLRTAFLEGSAGRKDYWNSESDLASYDFTFAQRIGWKWDYVLGELSARGWIPPKGAVLDWGCGSGIASRAFLDHFGTESVCSLSLWDRSTLAMQFAAKRARERFPALPLLADGTIHRLPAILLVSHVLTELNAAQAEALIQLAEQATAVVWVEPGTHEASRRLSGFRDLLQSKFQVVAPWTHQGACPILQIQHAGDWCHHFAPPPPAVFTDGNWARFASLAGIDPRSLPLSFLVLDQRPIGPLPADAVRILGRPRLFKAYAQLLGCESSGLHERRLSKRSLPEPFRKIRKGQLEPIQVWECDEDEVIHTRALVAPHASEERSADPPDQDSARAAQSI